MAGTQLEFFGVGLQVGAVYQGQDIGFIAQAALFDVTAQACPVLGLVGEEEKGVGKVIAVD